MQTNALLLAGCALLSTPLCAAPAVRTVPDQWPTIQSAIDASAAGDIVLVAPGDYRECIELRGRALTLASLAGPDRTLIHGQDACTVLTIHRGEGRDTLVQGFTLRGGRDLQHAGGVHVEGAAPTLRGNIVEDSVGGPLGHGISLVDSPGAVLEDNRLRYNRSLPGAHGAGGGGGVGVHGGHGVEILGNRIAGNQTAHSSGGGLMLRDVAAALVQGNQIDGNRARLAGGGIAVIGRSQVRIEHNLIVGNSLAEPGTGGGVHWLIAPGGSGPVLVGNTIADNHALRGSAVHADGDDGMAQVVNNLILGGIGASALDCGDFYDGLPPILLGNNIVGGRGGLCLGRPGATDGNLAAMPHFEPGTWRLAPGSPGIDAGFARFAGAKTDADGAPRLADGDGDGRTEIDIGAYETSAPR